MISSTKCAAPDAAVAKSPKKAPLRRNQTHTLADLYLHLGVQPPSFTAADQTAFRVHRFEPGEHAYHALDKFKNLYFILTGTWKTFVLSEDGKMQITGFPCQGEFIGSDGVFSGTYCSFSLALTSSTVIVVPFRRLVGLGLENPELRQAVMSLCCEEIIRSRETIRILGNLRCDARMALFLLGRAGRFHRQDPMAITFALPMSGRDIAEHLAMTAETVSRTLTKFQKIGLITIESKRVTLLDIARLSAIVEQLQPKKTCASQCVIKGKQ